jgi:hypothetical protein
MLWRNGCDGTRSCAVARGIDINNASLNTAQSKRGGGRGGIPKARKGACN